MNPLLVKLGVTIISASAVFLMYWINRRAHALEREKYCRISYTGNYDGNDLKNCSICYAPFSTCKKKDIITFPCKHKLCRKCCTTMFSHQGINKRNCPVCRQLVPEEIVSQILY